MIVKELIKLGKDIENAQSDSANFSSLSFEYLSKFENHLSLGDFEDAISSWTLEGEMPEQLNVYDGFGQPPVTVFNNGDFVVDLYFWMDIDTSIHSHSFSGAFRVLYGRSVHEEFQITPKKIISPDIMATGFSQKTFEIIKRNDCREIIRGNAFNHRLVHLDTPTITLCVRTINDKSSAQWHHFSNGLSVQKRELSQNVLKCLYYYNYLFKCDQEKAINYLCDLLKTWDLSIALNLYEKLSMDPMGIEEGAVEVFFEFFLNEYEETEWFRLYSDYFSTLQENFIELEGNSAETRFLEHALIFGHPREEVERLLKEIQGHELTEDQIELLSNL